MNITFQDLIAVAIVLAALGYLGRAVYRMIFGGKAACGGCGSCPSADSKTPPLVSLDLSAKPPSTPGPGLPSDGRYPPT
jgi:FeoB-associated Cys-rich membrane protein